MPKNAEKAAMSEALRRIYRYYVVDGNRFGIGENNICIYYDLAPDGSEIYCAAGLLLKDKLPKELLANIESPITFVDFIGDDAVAQQLKLEPSDLVDYEGYSGPINEYTPAAQAMVDEAIEELNLSRHFVLDLQEAHDETALMERKEGRAKANAHLIFRLEGIAMSYGLEVALAAA